MNNSELPNGTYDNRSYDIIVVGSGMGGVSAAAMLARDGLKVLILEAAVSPGGCSSSFYRQGFTFESGATTLIGFDQHQPLQLLENELGLTIQKTVIEPSMTVHLHGNAITRWQSLSKWLDEACRVFGEPDEQCRFWETAKKVSDTVWKVSGKNPFFPPSDLHDWGQLLKNNPSDLYILPYATKTVKEMALQCGISNPDFFRFLDEQLMISAQSGCEDTSFLFGAPALTYTNYTNYTVKGGMIGMIRQLIDFLQERGGTFKNRSRVTSLATSTRNEKVYSLTTASGHTYTAPIVVMNIPIWNLPDITHGALKRYFEQESTKYDVGWGAFTMGLVTSDTYPESMTLHHQIHADKQVTPVHAKVADYDQRDDKTGSVFVSLSHPQDTIRAKSGFRVLNVSTHVQPEDWNLQRDRYDRQKADVEDRILNLLRHRLPGFADAIIHRRFSATPRTWEKWVYRKKGRVGGIPQSMSRTILDWSPNKTPAKGVYLTGDTVYPGQGIPGAALGGILARKRIIKDHFS